jgi:hypothetical protein
MLNKAFTVAIILASLAVGLLLGHLVVEGWSVFFNSDFRIMADNPAGTNDE